jgi:mannose-6-phosphate isomerase-like protein (cupin superfamily)
MSVEIASGWTVVELEDAPDVLGDYPGEMRFFTAPLGAEQIAFTYRRMPAQTGGKGGYGHRHRSQEEIYFVAAGRLQFKLEDEIVEAGKGTAVRVAPATYRSVWNEGPDDAELIICSLKLPDGAEKDWETKEGFWPA